MPLVERRVYKMVVADFFLLQISFFYSFGVILLVTAYVRILVSHLGASFLKLPLQGYHPAGQPHPPTVDCGVVAKAARTVAVHAGDRGGQ